MWNTLSIGSLTLPAPPPAVAWTLADGTLDVAVWFAACAALGVTLSWLRELGRRDAGASSTGPRLVRTLGTRTGTLARA